MEIEPQIFIMQAILLVSFFIHDCRSRMKNSVKEIVCVIDFPRVPDSFFYLSWSAPVVLISLSEVKGQ